MLQVTPDILITSVLNPDMRIFDIVLPTEYGTSYNSYVIKGSEKIALIDSAHATFADVYLSNVDEALAGAKPDYLVLNHCEPDHTGSVTALLDIYPDLTILISKAGAINIKHITNRDDLDIQTVGSGDAVELGNKTLRFFSAPFLHWPDSIFTWVEQDKALFTCDFLGTHYCEPTYADTHIVYHDGYAQSVHGYFDGIFGQFKPYVLKGLAIIDELEIDFICTSHGPVLSRGHELERNVERYRKWATPQVRTRQSIPVFYCSAYGYTEFLASHIARGILSALPDAEVACYDIIKHDMTELAALMNASDAFLIGSPTLNRDAVEPVWNLLANVDAVTIVKRPVALFGDYGWSGEALPHLASRLTDLKVALFEEQFRVQFTPTLDDLKAAADFGKRFAQSI